MCEGTTGSERIVEALPLNKYKMSRTVESQITDPPIVYDEIVGVECPRCHAEVVPANRGELYGTVICACGLQMGIVSDRLLCTPSHSAICGELPEVPQEG